jgi:hypothetical protein
MRQAYCCCRHGLIGVAALAYASTVPAPTDLLQTPGLPLALTEQLTHLPAEAAVACTYRGLHTKRLPLNVLHTTGVNDNVAHIPLLIPPTQALNRQHLANKGRLLACSTEWGHVSLDESYGS